MNKEIYDNVIADESGFEIAVIGMSGRFPGAVDIDQFWENLRDGKETIRTFSDEEILGSGVNPAALNIPTFVKVGSILEDVDMFDAAFFRCSPREAKTMDPQHRLFLECAHEALQHAAVDPQRYKGLVGVFAGANTHTYAHRDPSGSQGMQDYLGSDRSFLSTRVSYKLNLKGPSLTIQTACSTSLVAIHMAYQSLLAGECDVALGGGVSLRFPQKTGYLYEKDNILSPDGHCRAFDASAQGTVGGEGVGIVVLKRLADAIADRDCIHAIIKGSALNNDGSRKVGFTAPSVEGQADAISRALSMAEVDPDSIGYIETHGTGTALGDPIEIAALTRAFRGQGSKTMQGCAIGSLKTNVGHMDSAAGVGGLIKTILALKQRQIPPSLHFERANPQIDFNNSPFYVNHSLAEWQAGGTPRRAGVSSFGIGGSNVHMVVEEAPLRREVSEENTAAKLLLLSTKTDTALDAASEDLASYLGSHTGLSLADVAYTLQIGRQQFEHRRMLVCDDTNDAIDILESRNPKRLIDGQSREERRPVIFMFPGQGSQYVNMGRDLYRNEASFRKHFDECCDLLVTDIGVDLRKLIFVDEEGNDEATQRINQTSLTQPALFAVEYSLARLWMSWGVIPQAMIGHSIGEYVAACLAGVFSLADALSLVSARALLMQGMESGSMLAVPMPVNRIQRILGDGLSIAAINEASMCVVSGATEKITMLESKLAEQDVECRWLHTSHAFHSEMMEAVVRPFEELVRGVEIGSPDIPYISNLSGTWVSAEEITDPTYWGRHLRGTVQFAAGLDTLFKNPTSLLLEVGPGQILSTLARRSPRKGSEHLVIASMRPPQNQASDSAVLMNGLGRLWLTGIDIDWASFNAVDTPRLVPLPGYPFERQSFWIDQQPVAASPRPDVADQGKLADPGRWFYAPGWKSSMELLLKENGQISDGPWLVFSDGCDLAELIPGQMLELGREITVVKSSDGFSSQAADKFSMRRGNREDMASLFAELRRQDRLPRAILHFCPGVSATVREPADETVMDGGFYSLLYLAQVLQEIASAEPVELLVITSASQTVTGSEIQCPKQAMVAGLCRVIPQEQDRVRCRVIDIDTTSDNPGMHKMAQQLMTELSLASSEPMVALRASGRWIQTFEPVLLNEPPTPDSQLCENGVYLITGGFGNIGLNLALYLAQAVSARLVLIGRSEFPDRDRWDECVNSMPGDSAVVRKILAVRALEAAGAQVMGLSADITDELQMRTVVDRVGTEFGAINGVIHAAAATGENSFQLLRGLDRESCELQFSPKIRGLQVLNRVLQGQHPDFCILMSSLASQLGGLRFAAYASANAFMDAFARDLAAANGLPWLSVNWDGWDFSGAESVGTSSVARLALTPREGVNAFARLLRLRTIPQLVISTSDLQSRLNQWVRPAGSMDAESSPASDTPSQTQHVPGKDDFTQEGIERYLCAIWTDLLGVEGIDVNDNFFDLGGDSLLALQVTSRLRENLIADLSAASVLEGPTIAGLTRRILEQQQKSMNNKSDKAVELLKQIKSISPEEREKLLAEARQSRCAMK